MDSKYFMDRLPVDRKRLALLAAGVALVSACSSTVDSTEAVPAPVPATSEAPTTTTPLTIIEAEKEPVPMRYSDSELLTFSIEDGENILNDRERSRAADLLGGSGQDGWVSENGSSESIIRNLSLFIETAYNETDPRLLWAVFENPKDNAGYLSIKNSVLDNDLDKKDAVIKTLNSSVVEFREDEQGKIDIVMNETETRREFLIAQYSWGHFRIVQPVSP